MLFWGIFKKKIKKKYLCNLQHVWSSLLLRHDLVKFYRRSHICNADFGDVFNWNNTQIAYDESRLIEMTTIHVISKTGSW